MVVVAEKKAWSVLITANGLEYEFVPIPTSSISVTDSLYMPKVGSFSRPFDIIFGVYTINLVEMLQRNEAESCNKLTLEKTEGPSRMDKPQTLVITLGTRETRQRWKQHKLKEWEKRTPPKNPWWIQVLAKCKHFLLFTRHHRVTHIVKSGKNLSSHP